VRAGLFRYSEAVLYSSTKGQPCAKL
jgi:hypothetical protein